MGPIFLPDATGDNLKSVELPAFCREPHFYNILWSEFYTQHWAHWARAGCTKGLERISEGKLALLPCDCSVTWGHQHHGAG